jgi:hypothetical protein
LLTLHNNLKKSFSISSVNSKLIPHFLIFFNLFQELLQKKGLLLVKTNIQTETNLFLLELDIYFSIKRSLFLKKQKFLKNKTTSNSKLIFKNTSFLYIFNSFFKRYKKNLYFFTFKNLNLKVNKKFNDILYRLTKHYIPYLFMRRFNLYLDFLNIINLFCLNLLTVSTVLLLISNIFRYITKRSHAKFFSFLTDIFQGLILFENKRHSNLKGLKFVLNGKLKGKTRASSFILMTGVVSNQTISSPVDFSVQHTYTRLGAFGMRLWVERLKH